MPHLKENRNSRETVFQGKILNVYKDTVILPNGKEATREVVEHSGAVAVLAIDDQDRIILVKQYRYPIQKSSLEIPAGKLEDGENPLECAKRELEEETGFQAENWSKIISFYTSPGFANEIMHLFLATGLTFVGASPDEDEFVELYKYSLDEAFDGILQQEIDDAKTINAILWHKIKVGTNS